MKRLAEKQLRNFSDKELIVLYQYAKTKEIVDELLPLMALTWAKRNCKELSDINSVMLASRDKEAIPFSTNFDEYKLFYKKVSDAQLDCIFKYKDSEICTKCKESTKNIIEATKRYAEKEIYSMDFLFLNIYTYTGLCFDCIVEFLHGNVKEHAAKIDDNTVNTFRQRVAPKVYTNLWDAIFH